MLKEWKPLGKLKFCEKYHIDFHELANNCKFLLNSPWSFARKEQVKTDESLVGQCFTWISVISATCLDSLREQVINWPVTYRQNAQCIRGYHARNSQAMLSWCGTAERPVDFSHRFDRPLGNWRDEGRIINFEFLWNFYVNVSVSSTLIAVT